MVKPCPTPVLKNDCTYFRIKSPQKRFPGARSTKSYTKSVPCSKARRRQTTSTLLRLWRAPDAAVMRSMCFAPERRAQSEAEERS